MKKTKIFLKMAALAIVGAMMSGCSEEIEALQTANQSGVQKITISLADDANTRGAIDPSNGSTTFSEGDQIAVVYQNTNNVTVKAVSAALTSSDLTDEGASATFTVELTSPKASTKVRYIYPASMAADDVSTTTPDNDLTVNTTGLATQDGTLATIANNYGLSVYDGMMSTTATLPTGTGVELKNQLSIVKLATITDGTNDMRANITDLTIDDGTNTYIISRTAEDAPIFVAMLPTNGDITFSTVIGGFPYTKTATGKTLAKNKIYPINLAMVQDMRATPLTFEAKAANATVTFDILTEVATNPVYYRQHNSTAWTDWALYTDNTAITLTNIGDIVQFKAENATYYTTGTNGSRIKCGADCYAYGNIMSLTDGDNFYTADELKASHTFKYLFVDNIHLQIDALRPLLLPATKLTAHCYEAMFNYCKALTVLPALPANELKDKCYFYMFSGCSQLTTVPEGYLPATQLAAHCYSGMFNGCTNLATVPTNLLPAETLAEFCYGYMFNDCSNLTVAPVLPAKTLVSGCYNSIFSTCTKLGSVTCLATNIYASDCLLYWLTRAGTAADCEPKVNVDPSMLNIGTGDYSGGWHLDKSGTDGKRWTLQKYVAP